MVAAAAFLNEYQWPSVHMSLEYLDAAVSSSGCWMWQLNKLPAKSPSAPLPQRAAFAGSNTLFLDQAMKPKLLDLRVHRFFLLPTCSWTWAATFLKHGPWRFGSCTVSEHELLDPWRVLASLCSIPLGCELPTWALHPVLCCHQISTLLPSLLGCGRFAAG